MLQIFSVLVALEKKVINVSEEGQKRFFLMQMIIKPRAILLQKF